MSAFSVPIFFVVFRDSLQASFILAVLLSLVKHVLHSDSADPSTTVSPRVQKKLRLQVVFGSLVGLIIALIIGAAFIGIWFTQATDLWTNVEQLWEGIFELIASLVIFVVGVTMLKLVNNRTEWRAKLQDTINGHQRDTGVTISKWILFFLPMIIFLREGVEATVAVGNVIFGEPASSIPLATIVGLIVGFGCGTILYHIATRISFKLFLIFMTNLILLIGAGLFSKAVWQFQENNFIMFTGASSDDTVGTGPGTYDVRGNVWALDGSDAYNGSWSVFNALFGWQNTGTVGSVLSYVFYWLAVIAALVYNKFQEGRTKIFGCESANGKQRLQAVGRETTKSTEKDSQADSTSASRRDSPTRL